MEQMTIDRTNNYESHYRRKKTKVLKPLAGKNPPVLVKAGKVFVKKKRRGFFKRFGDKLGDGIRGAGKGLKFVGDRWGDGVRGVGKGLAFAAEKLALAPLVPLKGLLKRAIAKKGLKPPKKLKEIAQMFFRVVVKKMNHADESDHFIPIAFIVPPIISYIKSLLQSKKAGAKLAPTDELIAKNAATIIAKIESDAKAKGIDLTRATEPETVTIQTSGGKTAVIEDAKTEVSESLKTLGVTKTDGTVNLKSPYVIGAAVAGAALLLLLLKKSK